MRVQALDPDAGAADAARRRGPSWSAGDARVALGGVAPRARRRARRIDLGLGPVARRRWTRAGSPANARVRRSSQKRVGIGRAVAEQRLVADHHRAARRRRATDHLEVDLGQATEQGQPPRRDRPQRSLATATEPARAPASSTTTTTEHRRETLEHRRTGGVEQIDRLGLGRCRSCARPVRRSRSRSRRGRSRLGRARRALIVDGGRAAAAFVLLEELLRGCRRTGHELGADVGHDAAAELGDLAGDGEIGADRDLGAVAHGVQLRRDRSPTRCRRRGCRGRRP